MIHLNKNLHPQRVPNIINLIASDDKSHKTVSENDSALEVMTDLKKVTAFKIESSASIDAINDKMIACGVKLLFVHDSQDNLVGLITTTDIQGEKFFTLRHTKWRFTR